MPFCRSVPIQPLRLKRILPLPIALAFAATGAIAGSSKSGSSDDDQAKRLDTVTVIGSRIGDADVWWRRHLCDRGYGRRIDLTARLRW